MRLLPVAATLTLIFTLPLAASAQAAATPTPTAQTTPTTPHHTTHHTTAHPTTTHHTVAKHATTHHTVVRHTTTHHAVARKSPPTKSSVPPTASPVPHVAAAPPPTPAPFSQNPILQLHGNAGALLLFAPDTKDPTLRRQMDLLRGHDLDLSKRNTVFVPIITQSRGHEEVAFGENISSGSYRDQLSARKKFGIKYNDFVLILLDKDGTERFRSTTPVPITAIETAIDAENSPTAPSNN